MNINGKILGIFFLISLIFSIAGIASAAENSTAKTTGYDLNTIDIINDTQLQEEILSNLESNGVDTSVLRASISVGATGKVKNILEYYKDKLEANPDYVKPQDSGNESMVKTSEEKSTPEESIPVPTSTQSPLSPVSILAGIGLAGCAALIIKR